MCETVDILTANTEDEDMIYYPREILGKFLFIITERTACINDTCEYKACQRMRITKVKTDPDDPTLTLSILSVRIQNA